MKKIFYLIICLLFISPLALALETPTMYVSSGGSGSDCTESSPCALSYANTNADGDDVVQLAK